MSGRRIAAGCVAVAAVLGAAGEAAARPVAISPAPGTPDASPDTQISVPGVPRPDIASVRVVGDSSGLHGGQFHAYSGRRGASFVLSRPLTQGERVSLTVRIKRRSPISYHFTVARLATAPPVINIPVQQPAKLQHFVSEPQLLPPKISLLKGSLKGDVFLTPLPSPVVHPESNNAVSIKPVGPGGPMIIDGHGRTIWFHQLPRPTVAANFQLQRLGGRPVLTWWQGQVTIAAYGLGEGVIADPSYRTIKTVHAGNGYSADIHEFRLTPQGDALFTVNSLVMAHLPGSAPGKLSRFLDSIVQEVDIRTGLVVWEWHALGHIPLKDSYVTPALSPYFDAYHLNSIEPVAGGRVLVSARDTCAVYEIDRASGRIVWTLGGKASSFRLGPGARFWFQHDARLLPGNRVTLFDDEAGPPVKGPYSRGLTLGLNLREHTARVVKQYHRPSDHSPANSEGSYQTLARGGAFLGFGSNPFFSEFAPSGRLVFDARLPQDDGSYRVFTFPWHATPRTRPAAVVKNAAVYASWNGATGIARWRVLAGSRVVASSRWQGFETRMAIPTGARNLRVEAVNAAGKVMARVHPA
jgi:Arylsulfotransferase (ASST)